MMELLRFEVRCKKRYGVGGAGGAQAQILCLINNMLLVNLNPFNMSVSKLPSPIISYYF